MLELYILELSNKKDASPLTQMHRFHNEDLVTCFLRLVGACSTVRGTELILEVVHFRGQNPSLGKEVVVIFEDLLHSHEVSA